MKISSMVSRSLLCLLGIASTSCATIDYERAAGHAGAGYDPIDRVDPIAINASEQRMIQRKANAGPTILCDEHGPRVVYATERQHRSAHAEAFGFTTNSQSSSLRMTSAEAGYLKLSPFD